jgi:hypothetical protein
MRKALGLIVVASLVTLAPPAHAATSVTFRPATIMAPANTGVLDHNVVALGTVKLTMSPTQTAYVVSKMHVNAATQITMADNEVRCTWPGGGKNVVMGQNLYPRGSSAPQWEDIWITTRFLVHPGVAAEVTCTTYIRTASTAAPASTLNVVEGSLAFADSSVDNTIAGTPAQFSLPYGNLLVDATHEVRQPALDKFEIAPGSTHLSVFGDTQYQACYSTGCPTNGASKAKYTLIINQWKRGGGLCHTDSTTATVTKTTPQQVHHQVVPLHHPNFEIRTGNDCAPIFNAYVLVQWQEGSNGAVQGVAKDLPDFRGSTSKHRSDMSHIYAVPYRRA